MLELKREKIWVKSYPENINPTINESEIVSVYKLLERSAKNFGNRIAIVSDEDESITYKELKEKVGRLASAWKSKGMKKGDRLGIMLPNVPYYFISYYAAMKLGVIVVQINPNYTIRELLQVINDSEIAYLVVDGELSDTIKQVKEMDILQKLFLTKSNENNENTLVEMINKFESSDDEAEINIEKDVAVIQYTGGTTGKIKGAMLSHANLVANVLQSYEIYGGKMEIGKETVLTATPLYHVYAMTSGMNLGIYIAATNVIVKQYNVENTLEKIKKYQPTYFPGVPRMYNDFVHHPNVKDYNLNCLKYCSSGSAPIPVELIREFERLTGASIAEGFGLTEASPSTHRNPPYGKRKIGSIGIPLPSTDCKIVDDDGNELPPDSIGELIIKGPQVMSGYWNKDDETKNTLRDGWLYTEDLARQDKEGYFYIVGRKKEMIITNGFNVYPQEVENVLYEHPSVKEVAVVGIEEPQKGEVTKAFLVIDEEMNVEVDELIGHCYKNLTPYKVPKYFEFVQSLPRNNVGKVLKTKLKELENSKK